MHMTSSRRFGLHLCSIAAHESPDGLMSAFSHDPEHPPLSDSSSGNWHRCVLTRSLNDGHFDFLDTEGPPEI